MGKKKRRKQDQPRDGIARARRSIARNRQARFLFELTDRWEAGLVLTGSEVKSCRGGTVDLSEAYVRVQGRECWLLGCHISPYQNAGHAGHEPDRRRKLLLHRREIDKMRDAVRLKGLTLVPTEIYFAGSKIKLEVRLARGKKLHDKRETVKKREQERSARDAVNR